MLIFIQATVEISLSESLSALNGSSIVNNASRKLNLE